MSDRLRDVLSAFDPTLPLERARTIPASWYTDPDVYEAERRLVFGRNWLVAGRAEAVARPGTYLTAEIAGEPLLVVRDAERVLHGFYNVCRHRAAPLLTAECGTADRLRCRYHGWTYDLAGRLRGTPEFDGVADFRREDNGLARVAVDLWGPLVGVHLGVPGETLAHFLSPLPARAARLGLERLRFVARRSYDLACNWKVYVDNYLDGGYHINTVHPGLAGVIDYSHYRTETFAWSSLQSSPLSPGNTSDPTAAVRTGAEAQYWWVFPNFMVNVYEGLMDTNMVLPLGPDRCRVVFDLYFADEGRAADETFRTESVAVTHQVQLEDGGICEEVQRGLGSRSYSTGRFGVKREAAGYHFHRLLARCLNG